MKFKKRTLDELADMICGNFPAESSNFVYRSSSYITRFFQDCELEYRHDGSTRGRWVSDVLETLLNEPQAHSNAPPEGFAKVIKTLMDPADALNEGSERTGALSKLNTALAREGYEAFFGPDKQCYLRHIATNTVTSPSPNPHRPFSPAEIAKRERLAAYMDKTSEDELITEILLPLLRQLGFHRVTSSGHKDKALEYGKDIWMKFTLPTQHILYFGIQAKKDKLDAAGLTRTGNANIAEILNQVTMMLAHEVFDPETNKRALVDHVFIVAGGEITKAARNWLGNALDASKRSQIMFMDRDDILNLFVVTNLPLPAGAMPAPVPFDTDIPF
ncbi:hypothetical protein [Tardiphaga sp. P5_C7]